MDCLEQPATLPELLNHTNMEKIVPGTMLLNVKVRPEPCSILILGEWTLKFAVSEYEFCHECEAMYMLKGGPRFAKFSLLVDENGEPIGDDADDGVHVVFLEGDGTADVQE